MIPMLTGHVTTVLNIVVSVEQDPALQRHLHQLFVLTKYQTAKNMELNLVQDNMLDGPNIIVLKLVVIVVVKV